MSWRSVPARLLRALRRFRHDRRGVTSVEFAMLAAPFFATLLAGLTVVYLQLAGVELETASQAGARAVMTGQATSSDQLKQAVCSQLGHLVDCDQILINLSTPATLTAASTAASQFDASKDWSDQTSSQVFGASGAIQILQLVYQLPVPSGPMVSFVNQINGTHVLVATQVFVHE